MKIYLDTNVVSLYCAYVPSNALSAHHWAITHALWDLLRGLRLRPITSDVTVEESVRGDKRAARRRRNALRGVTVIRETAPMRAIAESIEEGAKKHPHLTNDVRHFAAAWFIGANYLVTWNTKHFEQISALSPPTASAEKLPIVATPSEVLFDFAKVPHSNPSDRRLSPLVRELIAEETRAGVAIAKRDGFFDLLARVRKHPEQREHLLRTHRFITGKKA